MQAQTHHPTQFPQLKRRYQRLCILIRFTKQKVHKISVLFINVISVMHFGLAPSNFFVKQFVSNFREGNLR